MNNEQEEEMYELIKLENEKMMMIILQEEE